MQRVLIALTLAIALATGLRLVQTPPGAAAAGPCPTTWRGPTDPTHYWVDNGQGIGICIVSDPQAISIPQTSPPIAASQTFSGSLAVDASITVANGGSLSIAAGSTVAVTGTTSNITVASGGSLTVGAAQGPATTFDATSGYWGGFNLRPGSATTLQSVHLSHAGNGGLPDAVHSNPHSSSILVDGVSPVFDHLTLDTSPVSGIEIDSESNPTGTRPCISNSSFASISGPYAIQVDDQPSWPVLVNDAFTNTSIRLSDDGFNVSAPGECAPILQVAPNQPRVSALSFTGTGSIHLGFDQSRSSAGTILTQNVTWTNFGVPYVTDGPVEVSHGLTLTIPAGNRVQVTGNIMVDANGGSPGDLEVTGRPDLPNAPTGTPSNHVQFMPAPPTTSWGGIAFQSQSLGHVAFAEIAAAGNGTLYDLIHTNNHHTSLLVEAAAPVITDTLITLSGGNGVETMEGGLPVLSHDQFDPVATGLDTDGLPYYAIKVDFASDLPVVRDSSFTNVSLRLAVDGFGLASDGALRVSGLNFVGAGSIHLLSAPLMRVSGTWGSFGVPYILDSSVAVTAGATLTIAPGAIVQVTGFIQVGGGAGNIGDLEVQGTGGAHVKFEPAPPATTWGGIAFEQQSLGHVSYAELSNAGNGNLADLIHTNNHHASMLVQASAPTINNTSITGSGGNGLELMEGGSPTLLDDGFNAVPVGQDNSGPFFALRADSATDLPIVRDSTFHAASLRLAVDGFAAAADGQPRVSGLVFTGAGSLHLLDDGPMHTTGTWPTLPAGVPYVVDANVFLNPGAALIAAGNTVQVTGAIAVYGAVGNTSRLDVLGTSAAHVQFGPLPGATGWGGIGYEPSSVGTLTFADLTNAGNGRLSDAIHTNPIPASLLVESSAPTITHVTITGSFGHDVTVLEGGLPILENNVFGAVPTTGGPYYGVVNNNNPGGPNVDATHDDWGSASGPSGAGPGTGVPVSAGVDFYPWTGAALLTTLTLSSAPNPSAVGQLVTLTATVTGCAPAGPATVTFSEIPTGGGTVPLGPPVTLTTTGTTSTAVLTLSTLAAGSHQIVAATGEPGGTFGGGACQNSGTTTPTTQVVHASTTTKLGSTPNPATIGQEVTFTAKVTSCQVQPTGTVTFTLDGATLGTAPLDATGTAVLKTSTIGLGVNHLVTAAYAGDANCPDSTSLPLRQFVLTGDVNGDGKVDAIDALCVLRQIAHFAATLACPQAPAPAGPPAAAIGFAKGVLNYDVNGDGVVDAVDALCVLREVANFSATPNCPLTPEH